MTPGVLFTGIHGTWHRQAPWLQPDSDLVTYLAPFRVRPLHPKDPFVWSGDLQGWQFWRRWGWGAKDGDCVDWVVGGNALRWKLRNESYRDRGLIVHSHGLWLAVEAMAQGLSVPWMISIGSPARHDRDARIQAALPQLGAWLHIYDRGWDRWRIGGGLGDGALVVGRDQRFAGIHNRAGRDATFEPMMPWRGGNDALDGIGHTGLLMDPSLFHLWHERRWLDFMTRSSSVIA